MISRRQVLVASGLATIAHSCNSLLASPPRIGVLSPRTKTTLMPMLRKALAKLGYKEPQTVVIDFRPADDDFARLPQLARALIEAKCDLIVALGSEASARALRDAEARVPVIFIAVGYDPVERGIVESLGRPSGNMTGVYFPTPALSAKRLEIATEMFPEAKRFLVISDVFARDQLTAVRDAADLKRVELTVVEYSKSPYEFSRAFEAAKREGARALIVLSSGPLAASQARLSKAIIESRLAAFVPAIGVDRSASLVRYSFDVAKIVHRAAEMAIMILKGRKPADIPVERPHEFLLAVNMQRAKELGVQIPSSILARVNSTME